MLAVCLQDAYRSNIRPVQHSTVHRTHHNAHKGYSEYRRCMVNRESTRYEQGGRGKYYTLRTIALYVCV